MPRRRTAMLTGLMATTSVTAYEITDECPDTNADGDGLIGMLVRSRRRHRPR
jgi:hypothetical protein